MGTFCSVVNRKAGRIEPDACLLAMRRFCVSCRGSLRDKAVGAAVAGGAGPAYAAATRQAGDYHVSASETSGARTAAATQTQAASEPASVARRVNRAELVWEGKYGANGRRVAPLRVALPFQTVETVNESAQDRQRGFSFGPGFREQEWRNRLVWAIKNTSCHPCWQSSRAR
jgi:hypothetical protein